MNRKSTLIFTLLCVCLMMTTSVHTTQGLGLIIDPQGYLPIVSKEYSQRDALMALYHSTDGPNWTIDEGWGGTEPYCSWYGVDCRTGTEDVTSLHLPANNLNGTIPVELGSLSSLSYLFMHSNQMSGPIPAELGNLTYLSGLFLSNNQLSGTIPAELGNLSWIRHLILSDNQLSGTIPHELGNVREELNLSGNELSGPIPIELLSVCSLNLSHNSLNGSIPSDPINMRRNLDLYDNNLNSRPPIPPPPSCTLDVSYNNLSGPIPATLADLPYIDALYLNKNPGLICWETQAARDWAISLPDYQGPTAVCSRAN